MRLRDSAAAVLTCIALATVACGGKTSGSDVHPVAQEDFALELAHALCDPLGDCCARASFAYDAAACVETARAYSAGVVTTKAAWGGKYDAALAGACVAAMRDQAARCSDNGGHISARSEACAHVFVGAKQPGEPCGTTNDCALSPDGRVECAASSDGTGICQLRKRPSGGEPCHVVMGSQPAVVGACDKGETDAFACVGYPTSFCVATIPLGGACTSRDACVPSAFCDGATCVSRVGVGGPCVEYGCDEVSTCKAGRCVAKLPDGAACEHWTDCAGGNCFGWCSSSELARKDVCAGTK